MAGLPSSFTNYVTTSVDQTLLSPDEKTRLQHYFGFLLMGVPTMAAFAFYNLVKGNHLLFFVVMISVSGLVAGWFIMRRVRHPKTVYRVNTVLFSFVILYLLMVGGEDGSKILWMYTFPLISFFLFGKNEGLFWSATVTLLALFLFWNPFDLSVVHDYPAGVRVRFVTTYLIVSVITYWFEAFRFRYRHAIEQKNESLQQEINERKQAEKEREKLIVELQDALEKVETLSGFLPICSSCKKIRDDRGYWNQIESYIRDHSRAEFSHSICPECSRKFFGDLADEEPEKI